MGPGLIHFWSIVSAYRLVGQAIVVLSPVLEPAAFQAGPPAPTSSAFPKSEGRLTLNLGCTGIGFSDPARVGTAQQLGLPFGLQETSYKKFGPRSGFAWRPFGANRTVLRGGYGIFLWEVGIRLISK